VARVGRRELLSTIPGIGELTAVGLVAWITPIDRFSRAEKLVSYLGLCPTTHQSGDSLYHGKLKKDSNELIRTLLVEAYWTHRSRAERTTPTKQGLRVDRRRGLSKGTVPGAHSLVKRIFAMSKRKEPFNPHAPGLSTAVQRLRRPHGTAMPCVQRTGLWPSTANSLPAP
jgi:transposase